jgi:hypothetical protein
MTRDEAVRRVKAHLLKTTKPIDGLMPSWVPRTAKEIVDPFHGNTPLNGCLDTLEALGFIKFDDESDAYEPLRELLRHTAISYSYAKSETRIGIPDENGIKSIINAVRHSGVMKGASDE